MNPSLIQRLRKAAEGHAAANGDDAPNIFREALEDILRLERIANDIETLMRPRYVYENDHIGTRKSATERHEAGERLLRAFGMAKGKPSCV
ncbi:hypothetical protein [Magnetospirillum aberrantis]|uniref:Uncharacterized protein n=1 Tax=Magnetospirillum aberrantis SpK TaxID=908842 RepID=A0A7C9QT62_9PROT|nr:hypothetical protein [Magnetospirillum aberrantis]NFV80043.1 hypothetical protein [Magnetospirillum aberrantis SpK]